MRSPRASTIRTVAPALLFAAMLGMGTRAGAAPIVIDDFTSPDQSTCNPTAGLCSGPGSSSTGVATNTIDGSRTLTIVGGGIGQAYATVSGGSLNFATPVAGTGTLTVVWDLTPGGFDLATTGNSLFNFNFFGNDNGGQYTVVISDGANSATSGPTPIAAAQASGLVSLNLASFSGWGTVDKASLDSITFVFSGNTATDISFDDFMFAGSTLPPVPEPSTLVLLGSALVGLVSRRRRK